MVNIGCNFDRNFKYVSLETTFFMKFDLFAQVLLNQFTRNFFILLNKYLYRTNYCYNKMKIFTILKKFAEFLRTAVIWQFFSVSSLAAFILILNLFFLLQILKELLTRLVRHFFVLPTSTIHSTFNYVFFDFYFFVCFLLVNAPFLVFHLTFTIFFSLSWNSFLFKKTFNWAKCRLTFKWAKLSGFGLRKSKIETSRRERTIAFT